MSLRYFTAGESHGPAMSAILEGLPAGLALDEDMIAADLVRRQCATGAGDRMLIEKDRAKILAGVMEGVTTGAPVALQVVNADHDNWKGKAVDAYVTPRPGHADLAAITKYRYNDIRPSLERASARETAARVAVGAVCRAFLREFGITVNAYVYAIGGESAQLEGLDFDSRIARARTSDAHCPDPAATERIVAAIERAKGAGETLGGIIEVVARGVPIGVGAHVNWDRRLDTRLAGALMSMNAVKGVEIGDGFANAAKLGSQAHDAITLDPTTNELTRKTNFSGGIEGGISNGQPIWLRVAIKPIPTTRKGQETIDLTTAQESLTYYERSDICPIPRAVVVLEGIVAIVLADALSEKLGGDSMAEMQERFQNLQRPTLANLRTSGAPHVFWK